MLGIQGMAKFMHEGIKEVPPNWIKKMTKVRGGKMVPRQGVTIVKVRGGKMAGDAYFILVDSFPTLLISSLFSF
jgi:hypothetical protein